MQKTPYVFPIIGGRKVENLVENLEALDISLSDEHIKELESVIPFDVGFPNNFIVSSPLANFWLLIFIYVFVQILGRWNRLQLFVGCYCQDAENPLSQSP